MNMDGGKKARIKQMPSVYNVRVCSLNTTVLKMSNLGTLCLWELHEKARMCDRCKKWLTLYVLRQLNFMKTSFCDVNLKNSLFLSSLYFSLDLSVRKPKYPKIRATT